MRNRLADLLRRAASGLRKSDGLTPQAPTPEESEEAPTKEGGQTGQAANPTVSPPSAHLWERIVRTERTHLRWLRRQPWVIGAAVGLAVAIVVGEEWLITAWEWLVAQVNLYWPSLASHPVALLGVGTILFFLVFGLRWIYFIDDLMRWIWGGIKAHPSLSAVAGGILLLIGLWLVNNRGAWVVLPFTVGYIEDQALQGEKAALDGEKAAIQLVAELNQVGVGNPTSALRVVEPHEPRTSGGSVIATKLPLKECDTVLRGPGNFIVSQSIPLPRVQGDTKGSRLDLGNLSIGTVNIPLQLFTQFILKILPTDYREFAGQVNEHRGRLEFSVSSRTPPKAWRVVGPKAALPEMIEYLALRMALDLNPDLVTSNRPDTSLSDRDLAFAMGNQAFREQRYQPARAFFELADEFAPLDEKVDAMLGLAHYHLAPADGAARSARLKDALRVMAVAVQEDPNGKSSLLRPYLACLYHKAGREKEANDQRDIFTEYVGSLDRDFNARVEALKRLPLDGPGRHLSVAGGDVIYVGADGAIAGAAGQPFRANLALPDQNPRQIGLYGESTLLFISPDGVVLTYAYQRADSKPTILIEGPALKRMRQFAASQSERTKLFLLNLFGQVYWCNPAEAGSASACRTPSKLKVSIPNDSAPPEARQIFPVEDRLYLLAADGAVWRTEITLSEEAVPPLQQLTPAAPVHEIFVAGDDTLYLLHDNGNVWRLYDDGRPETEDLVLIDSGTNTSQIFTAGGYLYVLKNSGAVWRIRNPKNPADGDYTEIYVPPEGTTIQEMFITGASSCRTVYLLTDRREVLQGPDAGDARITLNPIPGSMPTAACQ